MSFRIIKAGTLSTVQDLGRFGMQHLGVGSAGAMDKVSARVANYLVGNSETEAVLELHFPAPEILITSPALIAIAGADFSASFENLPIKTNAAFFAYQPGVLKFAKPIAGARAYLSVHGGLNIEKWNGSYSTMIKAGVGGLSGRWLKQNDEITFNKNIDLGSNNADGSVKKFLWQSAIATTGLNQKISITKGREWDWLTPISQVEILSNEFRVSRQSDRMGIRMTGPTISKSTSEELISTGVTQGTIQLLPSGELIILMADNQTTGGYPRIAHVATSSIPFLAQGNPDDKVQFEMVDLKTAEERLLQQALDLDVLKRGCFIKLKEFMHEIGD